MKKNIHGFVLEKSEKIADIDSFANIYTHEKSGARLLHLENSDDNKFFAIGFRTIPADSNGIAHIIEHSVLSGSRKYKTKEPFMSLLSGSLNTFLNAITFTDRTIYPVSSRNEKDFENLMDVYLDAVLFPAIYTKPEIFYQEGWHYDIAKKEDPIIYKGVVYNEMRGAMSDLETRLYYELCKSQYPDTIYGLNSGGDPDVIPGLSYEEFLNFHKKYYHPSNSYIVLYGDMKIEKYLKQINEGFLDHFEKTEINSKPEYQKPFSKRIERTAHYPIPDNEDCKNKAAFALSYTLGNDNKTEDAFALEVLSDILGNSSASPVKKAILETELAKDLFSYTPPYKLQNTFIIGVKNADENRKEDFVKIVENELEKMVKNGIDKKLLSAAINKMEFSYREGRYDGNKGLDYYCYIMESWIYDSDPLSYLRFNKIIADLREKAEHGYFENFIKEKLLENNFSSFTVLLPEKGLAEKKDKILEEKLKQYKNSLSKEELDKLLQLNKKLAEMQLKEDTPEAKNTIPVLPLSEINKKAGQIKSELREEKGIKILHTNIFTSGIIYFNFAFDLSITDIEKLPYVSLLADLLTELDSGNFHYSDLQNEIYGTTGGITFASQVYENYHDFSLDSRFILNAKIISGKNKELFSLLNEICFNTLFENKKRIKELLQTIRTQAEASMIRSGHSLAMGRVKSYFSDAAKYAEIIGRFDYIRFIQNLDENFDSEFPILQKELKENYKRIFNKNNLIVGITCNEEDYNSINTDLHNFISSLNTEKYKNGKFRVETKKMNEGITAGSNVQYVSKGADIKKFGIRYSGSLMLLAVILWKEYLHNNIRAKGGAYGAGIHFSDTGIMTTYSYRDPNLKETVKAYDNMFKFIEELNLSEKDLRQFIIGTVSVIDTLLTPEQKGAAALSRYLVGKTNEDIEKLLNEVLNTNNEKLKSYSKMIYAAMSENYLCVIGNEGKIKENKELFKNIVALTK